MNSKKTVSMLFSILFIGATGVAGSSAWAAQSNLLLHGQLVYAGCDAQVFSTTSHGPAESKMIAAGERLSVALSHVHNACSTWAVPVIATYAGLTPGAPDSHVGVVTLTYQ